MRRSPLVLAATVAGTAGVLAFHPQAATVAPAPAAATSTATTATTKAASGASGTATGDAIATQYGNVQVKVTVKNGRITDVQALQLTGNDPRSAQISATAEPILEQEALSAQSASIDTVSGATYTSAGYRQSLQSALDKLPTTQTTAN